MKKLLFVIISVSGLLFVFSNNAMAQLNMKYFIQQGTPSKFIKEHPDYIYINKPERDDVTGFSYLISETLNPTALGLNKNNYYIMVESYDHNERPKALIWDGSLKQKLTKKLTTSSKKIVYFNNLWILDSKKLLHFEGIGEQFHFILRFSLSPNGVLYAKNRWYKSKIVGNFSDYAGGKVKVEWTDNPIEIQNKKKVEDKVHQNIFFQDTPTLKGGKGWYFDLENSNGKEFIEKFSMLNSPQITLWKDKDCTIPLYFCKMNGTEFTYLPDMNRDETIVSNIINLKPILSSKTHQYYFLDWKTLAGATEQEILPNGNVRLKAYYEIKLNAKEGKHVKGHHLFDWFESGWITLEVQPGQYDPGKEFYDPRNLCPPHHFKIISQTEISNKPINVSSQKVLPAIEYIELGENKAEFRLQKTDEGSAFYIMKDAVDSKLWNYIMQDKSQPDNFIMYGNDASFYQVMEFLEKLNEKTRNANLPYTFTLPLYAELKYYADTHDDFLSFYNTYVDSIQICNPSGQIISLEQFRNLPDKNNVTLYGGFLSNRNTFAHIGINQSDNIQIVLKAIPDTQQKEDANSSVTRIGLIKTWIKRCIKCGKEYRFIHRSKARTIQEMIEYADSDDDYFDSFNFCGKMIHIKDANQIREKLLNNKWGLYLEKSKEVTYQSPNRKEFIKAKKKNKKDTNVQSLEIVVEDQSVEKVIQQISSLGYKCVKKDLKRSGTSTSGNYTYDSYDFLDEKSYKVSIMVFHWSNRESIYTTFYAPFTN